MVNIRLGSYALSVVMIFRHSIVSAAGIEGSFIVIDKTFSVGDDRSARLIVTEVYSPLSQKEIDAINRRLSEHQRTEVGNPMVHTLQVNGSEYSNRKVTYTFTYDQKEIHFPDIRRSTLPNAGRNFGIKDCKLVDDRLYVLEYDSGTSYLIVFDRVFDDQKVSLLNRAYLFSDSPLKRPFRGEIVSIGSRDIHIRFGNDRDGWFWERKVALMENESK